MENRSPLVTVIIPSYNHDKWIGNAIESVLNQTYRNIELIIVDDGSTDNSKYVISGYASDPRVKIILKLKNKGQGHSFNAALDIASGKYITILPSDDWYLPEKTKLQVEHFESLSDAVGLVYGRGLRYFEDTRETKSIQLPMYRGNVLVEIISNGNFVYPASPMIRKSVFENIRFNEAYRAEGEAIFIKIAEKYEFDYVEADVVVMREHTFNTGSAIEMMYTDNIRWWTDYFLSPSTPIEVLHLKNLVIGKLHRMYGLSAMTVLNNFLMGRSALLKSIENRPNYLFDVKVLAGIFISFMPLKVAIWLVKKRQPLKMDNYSIL
jgi:alpha-1,3-rhamnosyltransferase